MSITKQEADLAFAHMNQAKRVVCACHRNPDGDAIGALLGVGLLLEKMLKDVPVVLHCLDSVPETFRFLPSVLKVQEECSFIEGDTVMFLDAAEPKLTGLDSLNPQLFDGSFFTINIDHHPTNTKYANVNLVDSDAASSCEIVVALADYLGWEMNSDIATCLLTGVYTDTGGLLHSNTTAGVYRTVARLLRAGARQQEIVKAVFRTASLSTLRLWGRVLENIILTEEGGAISAVRESDFKASGAKTSQLTGAIDYVNAVPGMRFSLILSEREGMVKGSLRTLRDDVDVAAMAGKFSGGGHKKAAGFSLPGSLKSEVRWKVVEPAENDSIVSADEKTPN